MAEWITAEPIETPTSRAAGSVSWSKPAAASASRSDVVVGEATRNLEARVLELNRFGRPRKRLVEPSGVGLHPGKDVLIRLDGEGDVGVRLMAFDQRSLETLAEAVRAG